MEVSKHTESEIIDSTRSKKPWHPPKNLYDQRNIKTLINKLLTLQPKSHCFPLSVSVIPAACSQSGNPSESWVWGETTLQYWVWTAVPLQPLAVSTTYCTFNISFLTHLSRKWDYKCTTTVFIWDQRENTAKAVRGQNIPQRYCRFSSRLENNIYWWLETPLNLNMQRSKSSLFLKHFIQYWFIQIRFTVLNLNITVKML